MRFIFSCLLTYLCLIASAQSYQASRESYINRYKDMAVKEMKRTGIPASITLSQAMLESDNGNSPLAKSSNNHFGIKCHSTWTGERVYKDDDHDNDCFRKYDNVYDSYFDHSELLRTQKRYAFLFDLKSTDYKGWARGLKKAGYATNPDYPNLLIKIIEDCNLQSLDEDGEWKSMAKEDKSVKKQLPENKAFEVSLARHPLQECNRRTYFIVKQGDTFESLNREMGLQDWQLPRYNDVPKDYKPKVGERLYTEPKRRRAEYGNNQHVVKRGETMLSVSQLYGIKLNRLYKLNRMKDSDNVNVGDTLWLRRRKPEK
jgi:LysM repeat protein